jgi:hypothetical protein
MTKEHRPAPALVRESADDTHPPFDRLMGAIFQLSLCGCTVDGAGTMPDPIRIVHCANHSRAVQVLWWVDFEPQQRGGQQRRERFVALSSDALAAVREVATTEKMSTTPGRWFATEVGTVSVSLGAVFGPKMPKETVVTRTEAEAMALATGQSLDAGPPTVMLAEGRVLVFAKLWHGRLVAVTYANVTQANRKAASLGPGWEVIGRRPWFLRKPFVALVGADGKTVLGIGVAEAEARESARLASHSDGKDAKLIHASGEALAAWVRCETETVFVAADGVVRHRGEGER